MGRACEHGRVVPLKVRRRARRLLHVLRVVHHALVKLHGLLAVGWVLPVLLLQIVLLGEHHVVQILMMVRLHVVHRV